MIFNHFNTINKMKNILLSGIALMGIMAFASCSSEEDEANGDQHSDAEAISFSTTTDMAGETRGTTTTTANATTQLTNFNVWAYGSAAPNDAYYMGSETGNGIAINRQAGNTWDYSSAADRHFWPGYALNFYAVSPATNANYTSMTGESFTYKAPTDNASQVDVMTAHNESLSKETTTGGVVPLTFEHRLSQIAFSAKTESSDMTVEIQSIVLHNILDTYTFDLKAGPTGENTKLGDTYSDYAVGLNGTTESPVTVNSAEAKNITADNGVLLLPPQTIKAWTDNTSIDAANTAQEGYLAISCKIKQGNAYLVGSGNSYGTTYVPFGYTWAYGNKYVYTLIFGVGKTHDGGSSSTPITFSVEVQPWTESSANNSDIVMP